MNIVLIGMPSSGKSSVGKFLAEKLEMQFIDTDSIILEKVKKPLKEVVDHDGLQKFLSIQNDVLKGIDASSCIISTGGSCIYNKDGMEHLKRKGSVFYLKIQYGELQSRINSGRRFARNEDQSFFDIYNERVPLYEEYSDYTIDCSGKTVEEVAVEIENFIN